MRNRLRLRFFAHSWRSDWNHGNAHFLRGLTNELTALGHEVRCYEAQDAWSLVNLLREPSGPESVTHFTKSFPLLDVRTYSEDFDSFAEAELKDADVVVVHEWTSPRVVETLLSLRSRLRFRLLFHDTHHRAYTRPQEIAELRVAEFDGVLAFGEAIRRIYLEVFGAKRAWTFHEAADVSHFFPSRDGHDLEVNWIGNWGDEERTRELHEFLIEPLAALSTGISAIYGVRYPESAQHELERAGIRYGGYLPNLSSPRVYARSALTLHIPRRCYSNGLSGIPTIRMFEAFACGVPLVCSPWTDLEGLFRSGEDYLCVQSGSEMKAQIAWLLQDEAARRQLSRNAAETVRRHHTCLHRAFQFEEICGEMEK